MLSKFKQTTVYMVVFTVLFLTYSLFKPGSWYMFAVEHRLDDRAYGMTIEKVKTHPSIIMNYVPLSKDLVIHRVYYDDRRRDGHDNQTVFFVDVNWTILESRLIIGCGVGNQMTLEYSLHKAFAWVIGVPSSKIFKYHHLRIDCYDMPVEAEDKAFVIYKTSSDSSEYIVNYKYPVIAVHKPTVTSNDDYNITVVACLKANSKAAPFLGEILIYQKLIGIDHVSLMILSTFIKDGGLSDLLKRYPIVAEYLLEGYVSIDMWKEWYNETKKANEIRYFSESIRKVACSYSYRGTYDFVFPIDTDDFFAPRVPGKSNIKYYLQKYCYENPIGSCMLKWITYYPEFCGLNDIPSDGNVTKALKSLTHEIDENAKSVHRTKALLDASFHDAIPRNEVKTLMPGFTVVKVDQEVCAVSHIRILARPKDGKCV